jgi:arylsulfatase A-like enzyme
VVCLLTSLLACDDTAVELDDAGGERVDAAPAERDAGRDATVPELDAGRDATVAELDAGDLDAGELDAGATDLDAGTDGGVDAGPPPRRPNILLIVADDLGYSDIGAFGGEIRTPHLDTLAAEGRLLTSHRTAATCAPTRAMLISGTDHHLVGLGRMGPGVGPQAGQPGYEGYLNSRSLSIAELLQDAGYHTSIAGKWHLGNADDQSPASWGFDRSYVLLGGVSTHFNEYADPPTEMQSRQYREDGVHTVPPRDFYSTDFYTDRLIEYIDEAIEEDRPFYAFAAYTTPHWPLQVPDEYLNRYRGRYDVGYEVVRQRRLARQRALGIIAPDFVPNPLLPSSEANPLWDELTPEARAYEARRMELYAAMVENLDDNIGRLIQHLKRTGTYDDTFILFQSDNGAEGGRRDRNVPRNAIETVGQIGSYIGLGARWAEVGATPFRLWKSTSAEGGVSVPVIAKLPDQRSAREPFRGVTHITDLAPTFLALARAPDPGSSYAGRSVWPITGRSLLGVLEGTATTVRAPTDVLADELEGNRYVIRGQWKLLWLGPPYGESRWELYDLSTDRGENVDVSAANPLVYAELVAAWDEYVRTNGVILR